MKTLTKQIQINSTPDRVFEYMDNLGNTGMHMMESSAMMMGSKLYLEQISEKATGLQSKFHWYGKMMGLKMDFTVVVTKWTPPKEKEWETIGEAKMIILGWYKMRLLLSPSREGTLTELSISYTYPQNVFGKILAFFLSRWYGNWCLKNLLNDSKNELE